MRQAIAYALMMAILVGLIAVWRWGRTQRRRDTRSIRYRVIPRGDEHT